ncbi:MAG: hypothetical protein ACXWEY_05555 [Bacteroidia bacterium]
MKHLKFALLFLLAISAFASCRKVCNEVVIREEITAPPKGEKVIYVGKHPECVGALLFKRADGTFLRATDYPEAALHLQPGDTVYIVFQNTKTDNSDGVEFATLPIEIKEISQPDHKSNTNTPGSRAE